MHVDALTTTKCGIFASAQDRTLQLLSQFLPDRCQDLPTQGPLQWQWKATLWNKDLPPCLLHGDFQGDRTKHQLLLLYLCNDQGMKTPTWSNFRSCVYFEDFIHTAVQVHNRCCTLLHTHTLHCSSISEVCIHWYSKSIQIVYIPCPSLPFVHPFINMSRLFFSRLTFIHLIPRNWTGQTSQFPKFQVHLRFQDGDASFHRPSPKVHLGIWHKRLASLANNLSSSTEWCRDVSDSYGFISCMTEQI